MDSNKIFELLSTDNKLLNLLCDNLSKQFNYIGMIDKISNMFVITPIIIYKHHMPNEISHIKLMYFDSHIRLPFLTLYPEAIEYRYLYCFPNIQAKDIFHPILDKLIRNKKVQSILN